MTRKKKMIAAACVAAVLLAGAAFLVLFFFGWPVSPQSMLVLQCDVSGGDAKLHVSVPNSATAIVYAKCYEEDGIFRINLKQVLASRWFRDGSFEADLHASQDIRAICLVNGNKVRQIWPTE